MYTKHNVNHTPFLPPRGIITAPSFCLLYFGRSGKQSEHVMHALHEDDGRGPGIHGVHGGRHNPMAAM